MRDVVILKYPTQLSIEAAQQRVLDLAASRRTEFEQVDLESAFGRVLARDVVAPHDVPPFANSAMDGYALRGSDIPLSGERRLSIVGRVLAGATEAPACTPGDCVRITTGAPLPPATDTVVMHENALIDGDAISIDASQRAGANVRAAGEDYRAGEVALRAGVRLAPNHLGVLAACGYLQAVVARRPRVALLVTGDELVPPDKPLAFGQIHDSNRYTLVGMLRTLGIEAEPVAHVRDDPDALRGMLHEAAGRCEVIITSGGVSAGEADYFPNIISKSGKIHFWKVRIKPGMPVLCGEIDGTLVFALPGNPVSTIVTFMMLVRPALLIMQGAQRTHASSHVARLATTVRKRHDRCEFLRGTLAFHDDAVCWAMPAQQQGSAMLRGIVEADALIVLPAAVRELGAGSIVEVIPLVGLC